MTGLSLAQATELIGRLRVNGIRLHYPAATTGSVEKPSRHVARHRPGD
jgi:hypothetical protein